MTHGLGYDPALEAQHRDAIDAMPKLVCTPTGPLPAEVDPRAKLKCNDQRARNTCCGNARDKVSEFCQLLETGDVVNLSAKFSYLTTKIVDGTYDGPDAGASISGAAIAATRYGECEEDLCPYWRDDERYDNFIPPAAYEQATAHKLRTFTEINDWDQGRVGIGTGQGGIIGGIRWTAGLANFRGRILTMADLGGQYLGEHAICFCGYTKDGKPVMYNSHGKDWGTDGTAEVDLPVIRYWIRESQHGFRLFSDLPSFRERVLKSWEGMWK